MCLEVREGNRVQPGAFTCVLARIDAVGVPTVPNASDSNGRRLGQGGGTVRCVPGLPHQYQLQQNLQKGWDRIGVSQPCVPPQIPLQH